MSKVRYDDKLGLIFHYTIETCLKRIGHGGYELLEKEMCRFAEVMSLQTHCIVFIT